MDNKKGLLTQLIRLANADEEVREGEYAFLKVISETLGFNQKELDELFEENIDYDPPKMEVERIIQFQRLVLMANVDGEVDESELALMRELGFRMGIRRGAVDAVFAEMKKHDKGLIPTETLLDIFKVYYN